MSDSSEPCPVCGLKWPFRAPSPCDDEHTLKEVYAAIVKQASDGLREDLKRIMSQ